MGVRTVDGVRTVVVGATAGIGRALAVQAARAGAQVLAGGRRQSLLDALLGEVPGANCAVVDVTSPESCAALREVARERLGGIDLVLLSAGAASLRRAADITPQDWDAVLRTNVIGASNLFQALLPVLEPTAVVAVLSSEVVDYPRVGLASYAASKAALNQLIRTWRLEHPGMRFMTVVVGATFPTEFGLDFDPAELERSLAEWTRHGVMQTDLMDTEDVAHAVLGAIAGIVHRPGVCIEQLTVRSPSPPGALGDPP